MAEFKTKIVYSPKSPKMYANLARWILLSSRFKELASLLNSSSVRFVPLKGLFFNTLIYPKSTPRFLNDIDILVPPEQFVPTCKLLIENGFVLQPNLWDLDASSSISVKNWPTGLNFSEPGTGFNLDLQWHIHERWYLAGFNIDLDDIWNQVILADPNQNVPWKCQLSTKHTLAQLCLHCSKDGMAFVKTYQDLDLYIRQLPADWDWSLFTALVKKWKMNTIAWQVIQVLKMYYQTPLPKNIDRNLQPFFIQKMILNFLMPTDAVLSDKPCLGKRYSKILKLAQIQNPMKIVLIIWKVIFPDKNNLLGRYGANVSLRSHWQHIFLRFFDQTNK